MVSAFDRLASDEIHQILTLTGLTGLCVVMPRVSKEMKAHAAAVLSSMEHIDISQDETVYIPLRPDYFTTWSDVEERCVPVSQIPSHTFDEDNLWATSTNPRSHGPSSKNAVEATAKMFIFVDNLKLVLSKTTALKSLYLEAIFEYFTNCDTNRGNEIVPLPAFALATVASTLRTLSVRVKPSSQTLLDIVSSCPGLEELSWRLVDEPNYGDQVKYLPEYSYLVLDESMVAALKHAKTACPNLTKLPMLNDFLTPWHASDATMQTTKVKEVRAFFALLRSWPNLKYAAIQNQLYSEKLITEAKAFAGAPGDFKGMLYILATDYDYQNFDEDEFTVLRGGWYRCIDLVNEAQLKVRVEWESNEF